MARFLNDFKKFALRGNVVDFAVGIVIGAAFTGVISSLVEDIILPPLGLLLGRVDFSHLYISLSGRVFDNFRAAQAAGAPTVNYGQFLNEVIAFAITAFAVFLVLRFVINYRAKQEEAPEATPASRPCPYCRSEISRRARKCPHCTADIDPLEFPRKAVDVTK